MTRLMRSDLNKDMTICMTNCNDFGYLPSVVANYSCKPFSRIADKE